MCDGEFVEIKKGSPYSITERRILELIPVLGSQPAGDTSHKPGGRLLFRQACSYPRNPWEGCYQFRWLVNRGMMGVNSLPKTVTRQQFEPRHSVPESSKLTTRLLSHPLLRLLWNNYVFTTGTMLWHCWLGGRNRIRPVKNWVVGAGMVICLEPGADLHMAQLMPLPLTVCCLSKIEIGFTFLVLAHPGSPGKMAVKRVCVCVLVH